MTVRSLAGFSNSGNGGNGGGWGFVPNGYGSWALTKDIYIGLGIGAPFGLKTEYDDPWMARRRPTASRSRRININPSIAWRATEWMSLGAGINYQIIDATYKRTANVAVAAVPGIDRNRSQRAPVPLRAARVPAIRTVKLELDDGAWGWNIGALFTLAPQTKIGMSYRSEVKYKT